MKVFTLPLFLLLNVTVTWGQQATQSIAEAEITTTTQEMDEHFRCGFSGGDHEEHHHFESWIKRKKEELSEGNRTDEILTIPVIFHIIHFGEAVGTGTNLSSDFIEAQLEQANNDLRKTLGTSGHNADSRGADTRIELRPATYDSDYNILDEPGINRIHSGDYGFSTTTTSYSKSFINNTIKPATQWNPNDYLNIWVCKLSGILGFGQFPDISGTTLEGVNLNGTASTDGLAIEYRAIGSTERPNPNATGAYSPYGLGRTLTHELGHFLGLRHIWGDGDCSVDDYCNDTPVSDGANYGCPTTHQSCGTLDMVRNYMDYTYDNCMNIFTHDQKARMRTVLYNSSRRVELLSSDKADPPIPLPVELSTFNVRRVGKDAHIRWETSSEYNNARFILSKSDDGINFMELHTEEGRSNSSTPLSYDFIDPKLPMGTTYYKLSQIDLDGRITELGTRSLEISSNTIITMYPNPCKGVLNIEVDESIKNKDCTISIFDMTGRQVHSEENAIGQLIRKIDISHLESGFYILRYNYDNRTAFKKFNKI